MANVYRVRTNMGGVTGSPYISTQFFEALGPLTTTGAQEAASNVAQFWTDLSAEIFTDVTITIDSVVDVLDELNGNLLESFTVTASVTQPAATGELLPPATQGLVRLLTGQIRNSHRVTGRIFIPGPTEIDSVTGLPVSTYRTTLETAATGMLAPQTESALAVWHRPVVDATGTVTRNGEAIVVTGVTSGDVWAILRSRRD